MSKLIVWVALICVTVPFSPKMPTTGLDYSWAIALNQAVAQGLVFGRDIIFTLGPYASVYTKVYHPSTDGIIIVGSLYFVFFYGLICTSLIQRHAFIISIVMSCIFLGLVYARDVIFFSYPLLLGVWIALRSKDSKDSPTLKEHITVAALFTPLGLLVLIKGTFLIQIIGFLLLASTYSILANKKTFGLTSMIFTFVSCCFFWLIVNQPLSALPDFIMTSIKISLGFSESMSREGDYSEIFIFLITAAIQLLIVICNTSFKQSDRILLFNSLFLFLFVSFKAGFTRHLGHAYIASTALLFSGIILSLAYQFRVGLVLVISSGIACGLINGHHTHMSLWKNIRTTLVTTCHGISNRLANPTWLKDNYTTLMHFIADSKRLPLFPQTSDIFSYDQVYLFASNNRWSPRPVFQSYSTFTPELAYLNQHKLQHNPPAYIAFRIQPIDHKLPALEDGPSWRVLLRQFKAIGIKNDYLILQKNTHASKPPYTKPIVVKQNQKLGKPVLLPSNATLVFAQISIEPTFLGKLWSFLYHPDQLIIELSLNDNTSRSFRLSANMAKAEFLLSPLVENTSEFGILMRAPKNMDKKKVKYFKINSLNHSSTHWSTQYTLKYTTS